MTLDQLEMLEAIIEEGSMQKAAKKIHKSQPSLSVGIKKIEEFYGIKLFSRESYRPQLTNEGEVFYQNARQVLLAHRNLHKVATELAGEIESKIKIAIDPIVLLSRIEKPLEILKSRMNTTQLILVEEVLEGPLNAVINNTVQFGVGHCPSQRHSEVLKKKICQIELIPVVKKNIDFKKIPNIVVSNDLESEKAKIPAIPTWFVSSHSRKEELILGGHGWGRMSRFRVKALSSQLSAIKSRHHQKIVLDIYLMANKNAPFGEVARDIWSAKGF